MTRPTKAWKAIALAGVAALALAACGGSDDTSSDTSESALPQGDGTLTIGTLLPQTGSLAFLGPPEFAGVDLAAKEINAAGGVLDKDVVVVDGDSGDTSTNIASQTVDRLLSEDVDAIVGAASSVGDPDRPRQDRRRGRRAVLAGQHLDQAVDLPRRGPVLPHRPAGHLPGRGPGQPGGRGRQRHGRRARPAGRLR